MTAVEECGSTRGRPSIAPRIGRQKPSLAALACGAVLGPAMALFGIEGVHAEGLQPGLWRVINKPEVNGIAGRDTQNMRCLSAADVEDLARTFSPVSRTVNSTCEPIERELTSQRLKWRLQCRGQLDMDLAGEFIFDSPTHYSATIEAKSSMMGQTMQNVRTLIEGQWIGECR